MQEINLFCLPFAGGNRHCYREFELVAPSFLKLVCLEYPGRGSRTQAPLLTNIHEIVNDCYEQIRSTVNMKPFAIYGHSMGGLVAFLLAQKIVQSKDALPRHVFVSGTSGPSSRSRTLKKKHLLSKQEFLKEIKKINGDYFQIFNNDDVLDYFEPVIRADFMACETYVYSENVPLEVPFTIFYGNCEDLKIEDINLWQRESKALVDYKRFPGKHFFIMQYPYEIVKIISNKLFRIDGNQRL